MRTQTGSVMMLATETIRIDHVEISYVVGGTSLLVAQRHHRVQMHGAPRWRIAGPKPNPPEQ
jgi:hypothetical protein